MTTNQSTGVTFHPISQRDKEHYGEDPTEHQCYYCQEDLFQRDANGIVTEAAGEVLGHYADVFYPHEEDEDGEQQSLHLVHRHCLEGQAGHNALLRSNEGLLQPSENDIGRGHIIDCGVCRRKISNMDEFIVPRVRFVLWLKASHPASGSAIQNVGRVIGDTWQRSLVSGAIAGAITNVIRNDRSLEGALRGAISGGLTGVIIPVGMGLQYNNVLFAASGIGYQLSKEGVRRVHPEQDRAYKLVSIAGSIFMLGLAKLTRRAITAINKAPESRSHFDIMGFYNITGSIASTVCYLKYREDVIAFMRAYKNQVERNQI